MTSRPPIDRLPRRLTVADLLLAAILAAAALLLWVAGPAWRDARAVKAGLVAGGSQVLVVPLDRDGRYPLPGPLGESVAEVRGGRVRMLSSPCDRQLCVRQGWSSRGGDAILCAPNRVGILLRGGEGELDAVSR